MRTGEEVTAVEQVQRLREYLGRRIEYWRKNRDDLFHSYKLDVKRVYTSHDITGCPKRVVLAIAYLDAYAGTLKQLMEGGKPPSAPRELAEGESSCEQDDVVVCLPGSAPEDEARSG